MPVMRIAPPALPLSKRAAALKLPPKNAQLVFFSLNASPIVRSVDGGIAVPAVISPTLMAPFERKLGRVL